MKVLEVLLYFLRLGTIGFGGPLALVAQMQSELVEQKKWISIEEFQKVFSLIKAMPGAVAFSTAVYIGRRRAGLWGGVAAAFGLILPAFLMVLGFATIYSSVQSDPRVGKFLLGMQAAAIALILAALRSLIGNFLKSPSFWVTAAIGATAFFFAWMPEPALILCGGFFWILVRRRASLNWLRGFAVLGADSDVLTQLMQVCFKAGAFIFGSGIAIAPLLEKDFVERLGWVTHAEFMDALAVGQATPGPVLLTTTFLGFKVAGLAGALLATGSVFFASFFHMMTWFPSAVNWLSRQKWIDAFLFGALAMVVGTILMTVVTLVSHWKDQPAVLLLWVVMTGVAFTRKVPSWALVLLGGGLGLFF